MLFSSEELRVFNTENSKKNDKAVRECREEIKGKLLEVCEAVKEDMGKMDLYHHKDTEHIISLTIPCVFNKGVVNWLGLRFGKHPDIIDKLNFGIESKDEAYGFQRHNCFQLDVSKDAIEMGLFHAVPSNSVDRMYMHQNLGDKSFREAVGKEICKLVGYGFVWSVGDENFNSRFDIDEVWSEYGDDVGEMFCKWYEDNDRDGLYSSMLVRYSVLDKRVKDFSSVVGEFKDMVRILLDLYKLVSWM